MRRRALLISLAAAPVGLAGCLGDATYRTVSAADAPPDEEATRDAGPSSTHPPSKPVRCRGDPVSVERTMSDAPGYSDNIEYYPGNATVRFVAVRSSERAVRFGEMSFERWASTECAEAGLERVRAATEAHLASDEFGSGIGQSPGLLPSRDLVIRLNVATRVDGEETAEPPAVSLSRLADAAPRSVDATVSLAGDSFSRAVPVFAEHVEVGLV